MRMSGAGWAGWVGSRCSGRPAESVRLIVEQSLDDERESVRERLLVWRRGLHVVRLAIARGVAAAHLSAIVLREVGHVGGVEVVLAEIVDQVTTELACDRHLQRDITVAVRNRL